MFAPVVSYCFQALLGHKKQHALLEADPGRGLRLSSPGAHFSEAQRGAEASTVGAYRAELHKRALQRERTTAYSPPGKACDSSTKNTGAARLTRPRMDWWFLVHEDVVFSGLKGAFFARFDSSLGPLRIVEQCRFCGVQRHGRGSSPL